MGEEYNKNNREREQRECNKHANDRNNKKENKYRRTVTKSVVGEGKRKHLSGFE
jgi:hypothetical protein